MGGVIRSRHHLDLSVCSGLLYGEADKTAEQNSENRTASTQQPSIEAERIDSAAADQGARSGFARNVGLEQRDPTREPRRLGPLLGGRSNFRRTPTSNQSRKHKKRRQQRQLIAEFSNREAKRPCRITDSLLTCGHRRRGPTEYQRSSPGGTSDSRGSSATGAAGRSQLDKRPVWFRGLLYGGNLRHGIDCEAVQQFLAFIA